MLTTLNTWLVYFWLPPAADGNLIGSLGFSGAAFLGRLIEGVWGVQSTTGLWIVATSCPKPMHKN